MERKPFRLTRRDFLKRGAATAATLLLPACSEKSPKPLRIEVEDRETIGAERVQKAIKAAQEWDKAYGCGRTITIRSYQESEVEELSDGSRITTLEVAGPGYIELGSEGNVRNIVLHSMTHACVPNEPTLLPKPIPFSDGQILGFHGLSILVRLHDGTETAFRKIEEGVCERNASLLGNYSVDSEAYFNVGFLTSEHFPRETDAHQYAKQNDVIGFTAAFFKIDRSKVTSQNILDLMTLYQNTWRR